MAELGVGVCRLALALLERHRTLRLHMVDNFLTAKQQPVRYTATRDNFALRDAMRAEHDLAHATQVAKQYKGRAVLHYADTSEAAKHFADGSLDMVFIDADHSYEGVKNDIACWLPKAKRGGWIGGHDYENGDERFDFSGVKRAVDEFSHNFGKPVELDANFTWWVRL